MVTFTVVRIGQHLFLCEQGGDAIGELNLTARAFADARQRVKDLRRQHTAAVDNKIGRRLFSAQFFAIWLIIRDRLAQQLLWYCSPRQRPQAGASPAVGNYWMNYIVITPFVSDSGWKAQGPRVDCFLQIAQ